MEYLLKVSLNISLFYLLYKILFQRMTCFQVNRFYLLGSSVMAFIIPALPFALKGNSTLYAYSLEETVITPAHQIVSGFGWSEFMLSFYLAIVVLFITGTLWQLIGLFKRETSIIKKQGYTLHFLDKGQGGFSFFHHIFIPMDQDYEESMIFKHEQVHARQWHSLDTILIELVGHLLWFLPSAKLYRKELKQVHEYLADEGVCKAYGDSDHYRTAYCELLIEQTFFQQLPFFVHSFHQPTIKNRIIMIIKRKENPKRLWRYIVILPFLTLCLIFTKCSRTKNSLFQNPDDTNDHSAEVIPNVPGDGNMTGNGALPFAEKLPEYKGGPEAMMKILEGNLKYPDQAKTDSLEGRVIIQFVVTSSGRATSFEIVSSSKHEEMDKEAMRVTKLLQDWYPGKDHGKYVDVKFTLPIQFKLK